MRVATFANARTALQARHGVGRAFAAAFRSGAAMGFLLASSALLVLYAAVNLFGLYYGDDWGGLYESITGYGLGGSSVALFGRVGGGIYTKAADVGADLVGKVERNIPEDDPRNPAVRMHVTVTLSACNGVQLAGLVVLLHHVLHVSQSKIDHRCMHRLLLVFLFFPRLEIVYMTSVTNEGRCVCTCFSYT
jgi:Na+/H+-translocating membrane pyrophosphatase